MGESSANFLFRHLARFWIGVAAMPETVTNLKWAIAFLTLKRLSVCGTKRAIELSLRNLGILAFFVIASIN
jgi:hypothetical protein